MKSKVQTNELNAERKKSTKSRTGSEKRKKKSVQKFFVWLDVQKKKKKNDEDDWS